MKNIFIILIISFTLFSCENESNRQKEKINELNLAVENLKSDVNLLRNRMNRLPPIVGEVKVLNVNISNIYHGDMSVYVDFIDLKTGANYSFAFWSWTVKNLDIFYFSDEYLDDREEVFIITIEYRVIEEFKDGPYSEYFGKADVKTGNLISMWVLKNITSINEK